MRCLLQGQSGGVDIERDIEKPVASQESAHVEASGKVTYFGPDFVYPGGVMAINAGGTTQITLPGIIGDTGLQSFTADGLTVYASGGNTKAVASPAWQNQTPAGAVLKKSDSTALVGVCPLPRIQIKSKSGVDFTIPNNGSANLAAQMNAFPAMLCDDKIRFFIPMGIAKGNDPDKLFQFALTFKKAATTPLQFFYRTYGTKAQKSLLTLNDPNAFTFSADIYGVSCVYQLPSATGKFVAGCVCPKNTSNAITLAWEQKQILHMLTNGKNYNTDFWNDVSSPWAFVRYVGAVYHKINTRSDDQIATSDPWLGVQVEQDGTAESGARVFSTTQIGLNISQYSKAILHIWYRCDSATGAVAGFMLRPDPRPDDYYHWSSYESYSPAYTVLPQADTLTETTLEYDVSGCASSDSYQIFLQVCGGISGANEIYISDIEFVT